MTTLNNSATTLHLQLMSVGAHARAGTRSSFSSIDDRMTRNSDVFSSFMSSGLFSARL
jgi:hypothetical protein